MADIIYLASLNRYSFDFSAVEWKHLDRKEIRDAYDLEFLARKSIALPDDENGLKEVLDIILLSEPGE